MSTDRKKKKRRFAQIERIKIIEYGCIGLVILLFVGLAVFYGKSRSAETPVSGTSPTAEPTADTSIRGMNILDALEQHSFEVIYRSDRYDVQSPDGVAFTMQMESDDRGLIRLSFETLLCADPDDETETAALIRSENRKTIDALRALLDAVMPVFRRTIADSDTFVKQCQKTVQTGEPYSKHFGTYSVRIVSDPSVAPQTATILFLRDS